MPVAPQLAAGLWLALTAVGCSAATQLDDAPAGDSGGTTSADTTASDEGQPVGREEACQRHCAARVAACPGTDSTACQQSCEDASIAVADFCAPQYGALLECESDAGFRCVDGLAEPTEACGEPRLELALCTVDLPCKKACAATTATPCDDRPLIDCIGACSADQNLLPTNCRPPDQAFRDCLGSEPLTCDDGRITPSPDCLPRAREVGRCIVEHTGRICEGYCIAANATECPNDCESTCEQQLADPSCGALFEDLVDCGLKTDGLRCGDGGWVRGVSLCTGVGDQYADCVVGQ